MQNPWLGRSVLAYAHQGGALEAPSSTLYAMRRALEAGADALELDVHRSADGHLVVCHDERVDRMTDGSGAVAEMELDQLRSLDAAYWFVAGEGVPHDHPDGDYAHRGRGPAEAALRIPTLQEVLEEFPGVLLNLDIKQTAPDVVPYEEDLARLLCEYGRVDDVIVASFHDRATDAFRGFAPGIGTSPGTAGASAFWRAVREDLDPPAMQHVALQVPARLSGVRVLDETFVGAAHSAGLAVHVWTVDDPSEIEWLVGLGVDGIMSDRPSVLLDTLRSLGARRRRPSTAS